MLYMKHLMPIHTIICVRIKKTMAFVKLIGYTNWTTNSIVDPLGFTLDKNARLMNISPPYHSIKNNALLIQGGLEFIKIQFAIRIMDLNIPWDLLKINIHCYFVIICWPVWNSLDMDTETSYSILSWFSLWWIQ